MQINIFIHVCFKTRAEYLIKSLQPTTKSINLVLGHTRLIDKCYIKLIITFKY